MNKIQSYLDPMANFMGADEDSGFFSGRTNWRRATDFRVSSKRKQTVS
jgi:hypothetical protein